MEGALVGDGVSDLGAQVAGRARQGLAERWVLGDQPRHVECERAVAAQEVLAALSGKAVVRERPCRGSHPQHGETSAPTSGTAAVQDDG